MCLGLGVAADGLVVTFEILGVFGPRSLLPVLAGLISLATEHHACQTRVRRFQCISGDAREAWLRISKTVAFRNMERDARTACSVQGSMKGQVHQKGRRTSWTATAAVGVFIHRSLEPRNR